MTQEELNSQFTKKRSCQIVALAILGILIVFALPPGCFLYNIHRDCVNFVQRRAEATRSIVQITAYNKEHGYWPEQLDEKTEITLPSGWQYHFFTDGDPFIQLMEGKKWLRYQFEETKDGHWAFFLEGDRMKWSVFAKPLPSDPKEQPPPP